MLHVNADASSQHNSEGGRSLRSSSSTGSGRLNRSGSAAVERASPPAVEGVGSRPPSAAKPAVARKETPSLQVRARPRLATGATLQWQQLTALTRKNLLIRGRAWKTNLLLILQAVLFTALIWGVDRAVSASRQRQPAFSRVDVSVAQLVGPVPDCASNSFMRSGQPCHTFLYVPTGDPSVEAVVRGVMSRNDPPIPPQHVMGLANATAVDAWLMAHPETVLATIIFSPPDNTTAAPVGSAGTQGGPTPGASAASLPPSTAAGLPTTSPPFLGNSTGFGTMGNSTGLGIASTATPGFGPGTAAPGNGGAPGTFAGLAGGPVAGGQVPRQLGFSVQTNSSVQWFKGQYQHPNTFIQLPLQVAVEREIARLFTGNASLSWDVGLAQFPHPTAKSPSMIGQFAPTFLFASIMFQFVLLVHDVVHEKEGRARQMMATMGLRALPFWASWVLFQGLLATLEACLLVGFGYAFGFKLFTGNAFGLSFLLLLLVSLAMTAFGFFIASLLQKSSTAVPAGFLLFVVAWVIIIVIAFGFPFKPSYSTAAVATFAAMPWSLLAKGVQDLASATDDRNHGIPWADRFAYCQAENALPPGVQLAGSYWQGNCVMPLGQMFWVLAVQCVGFMALAVYLDGVLPDANGVRRPPWFFLLPSYWGLTKRGSVRAAAKALAAPTEADSGLTVDTDVAEEQLRQRRRCAAYLRRRGAGHAVPAELPQLPAEAALAPADSAAPSPAGPAELAPAVGAAGTAGTAAAHVELSRLSSGAKEGKEGEVAPAGHQPFAVEMFGLRKVYKRGGLLRRKKPFIAVRGNWLGVHQGECFCLLGPNGAGKSTTINCLTGVLPFDGGDALVCGESIAGAGGMDRVRPLMGVCPQFDVLWEQLTGREHLMLFGAIKGLPASERGDDACRLLEDVRLTEAGRVRAGAYSGGMKRRLSVAIALLGDPQVVYLDEPTTGLDPISRRHLWDLIDRAKRDRAVVLTTHSMEEADILGDRIGIMARGRLRCIGTSLRLKARFGSGYRVSIRVQGSTPAPGTSAPGSSIAVSSSGRASTAFDNPLCEIQPEPGQQAQQAQLERALRETYSSTGSSTGSSSSHGNEHQRDPAAARQAAGVRALFLQQLGIKPSDESLDYLHFLVPYEHEDRLPALFSHLKAHQAAMGVADVQLRLTPLEEVFLNVARKAELEHAQLSGHKEALSLAEEGVTVQVPIGAEFIQSPAGHLYHIRWGQDPDTGELKLQDYWRDPLSTAAAGVTPGTDGAAGSTGGPGAVAAAEAGQARAGPGAAGAAARRLRDGSSSGRIAGSV